ncbi:hypothetical protein KC660_02470 [Candidatus Dojkabacteria bacterium]|uniref:Uncharacterized protein n=1 Tax=Candidatus Dojkabacteria bacterium TaxID=2099670 RepID=A0A955L3K6_9BACT|nr:hypothetical protein [Candidatus Dojkabacteria bacterium]
MPENPTPPDNITLLALDWGRTLKRNADHEIVLTADVIARRIAVVDFFAEQALQLLPKISFPEGYLGTVSPDTNNLYLKFPTSEEYADGELCHHIFVLTNNRLIHDEDSYRVWCEYSLLNRAFFEQILQQVWLYQELDHGIGWKSMLKYWKSESGSAFLNDLEYDALIRQYYEASYLQQVREQTHIALQFYYDTLVDFANDKGVTLRGILG